MAAETTCALQCYSGSLKNQNTDYAFDALANKTCGDAVKFCTSTYLNDGWGITITMDCDDSAVCVVSSKLFKNFFYDFAFFTFQKFFSVFISLFLSTCQTTF